MLAGLSTSAYPLLVHVHRSPSAPAVSTSKAAVCHHSSTAAPSSSARSLCPVCFVHALGLRNMTQVPARRCRATPPCQSAALHLRPAELPLHALRGHRQRSQFLRAPACFAGRHKKTDLWSVSAAAGSGHCNALPLRCVGGSRHADPGTCRHGPCSWFRTARCLAGTAPAHNLHPRRFWRAAGWC